MQFRLHKTFSYFIIGFLASSVLGYAQTPTKPAARDTTRKTTDARKRLYARWNDRLANRLNDKPRRSSLFLKDPKNVSSDIKLTPNKQIAVVEKVGEPKTQQLNYRNPSTMSYEQFQQLQNERVKSSLWREYSTKQDGKGVLGARGLLPKLELPASLDRIFGSNLVDFKPNGFVQLDFAVQHQRIDNPLVPIGQRQNTIFLFDQQININFNGKIGNALNLNTNFDTKASFNFENQFKINYKPEEHSLLQGVQLGNISWQLPTQLITGVQNLQGIKTDFRFGKLNVSAIISRQISRQQCITLRGGTQNRPFEIKADAYDENRNFFLSQFFRNNYEKSLKNLPMITSGVLITRVEVYITNRTNNTETLRSLVGFADLGESKPYNTTSPAMSPIVANASADNKSNGLYKYLVDNKTWREIDKTTSEIAGYGLRRGADYDILRGARRLRDTEFRFHPELGYISLLSPLRNDEVLAVAYEYTYQGRPYKVGELTEDYANLKDDQVLALKLLKSSTSRNDTQNPMWNLMMKNVYSLGTSQIGKQGFQMRIIYKDDLTGLDNPNLQEGKRLQNVPLLRVMNLDRLNALSDPQPDGNFDFIEGTTIDSRMGKIIFPVLEPFGSSLAAKFDVDEEVLKGKYVYDELYRKTQVDAQQITEKNKFFLKGSYQGAMGGGSVPLPMGVTEQSVQVRAAGAQLAAGTDYIVDAQIGQVRIINESVANSGRDIEICYEQPDLFQNQTRTTLGTRFEYLANPNLKIGGTVMRLRETPTGFISRTAIGNEPINNTMIGADINYQSKSRFLTRLLDAMPLLQTKEESDLQFQGEVAQLYSGISPQTKGRSFIDDFEAARTPFDLARQPNRWRLGGTPIRDDKDPLYKESISSGLEYAYHRAKISAYSIDNTFYGGFSQAGTANLTPADLENYYERSFYPQDIFTGRSQTIINLPQATFDLSYFPSERGMYNFNTDLDKDGLLKNPRLNYGALTRAISADPDFDNANIENIEFWVMDPFIKGENGIVKDGIINKNNDTGGKLFIHLGEITEDVLKNGRYDFENGLPIDDKNIGSNVVETTWGNTTKQQFLNNAFSNYAGSRQKQDVGLDGLSNEEEQKFFNDFLKKLPSTLAPAAKAAIQADPSADDFKFYFSKEAAEQKLKIVQRYKNYSGMENNSPEYQANNNEVSPTSAVIPDVEDLNIDNTINDLEQYFEYEIPLNPQNLSENAVGKGYIVDRVNAKGANWYLFRIPVREFTRAYGGINGFKNIRFIRLVMSDWAQPVVLRFAQFQMVATQYRKYTKDLTPRGLQEVPEPYDAQFVVSTVSAEENSAGTTTNAGEKYIYTSPPGFARDRDFTQTNFIELNEQAMSLCVTNLRKGDSRAAFKNVGSLNILNRKRLKMFLHVHSANDVSGKVAGFLRFGTDVTENYYEIEVDSLQATKANVNDPSLIWPFSNELDLSLEDIINIKTERDRRQNASLSIPFTKLIRDEYDRKYKITVVGRPDMSAIMMLMLGVRNPVGSKNTSQEAQSFCIWVNELHTEGYETQSGTAALANLNLKLADFATIQATGRITTFGFGTIQQKPNDRGRDNTKELSISANIALDKLLPQKWNFKIPLFVNYDNRTLTPQYNPLDPDMPLQKALDNFSENDPRRAQLENIAIESNIRKGFNFANVRKMKANGEGRHFWDFENLSFTYAYNTFTRQNSMIAEMSQIQRKGSVAYQYGFAVKSFEPFKNVKGLNRPYLELIKNLNVSLLPTTVSVRLDFDRSFIKTIYRNSDLTGEGQEPIYEKYLLQNRQYDLTWNLTKNLNMSFSALKSLAIDEPFGDIDTDAKKNQLLQNFWTNGRAKSYDQNLRATYRIPFDQFPLLDWVTGDYNHTLRYQYSPTQQAIFQDRTVTEFNSNKVGYQFTPNSFGLKDENGQEYGTTIRNNKEWSLIGRVDFVKLYNKLKYLNFANRPSQARKNFARSPGDDEEITREPSRFMKNLTRFLMAVRGIDVSYTETTSSTLSGFTPTQLGAFGLNEWGPMMRNFAFGSQNPNFHRQTADRGWLTKSKDFNQPFIQTLTKSFRSWATVEPAKDLRIKIEVRRNRGDEYKEIYKYDPTATIKDANGYVVQSPVRTGNFEMSFISIKTTFEKMNKDLESSIYNKFKDYRQTVLDNLSTEQRNNPEYNGGKYTLNSQDVLIAAFFAAYNGKSKDEVKIDPFPNLPLPNWSLTYGGLSQLKPFKKLFSSFSLEHNYQSTYSVGNFTSTLFDAQDASFSKYYVNLAVRDYGLSRILSEDGYYIPKFEMTTITLSERFAPLIGISARTKSRIDFGIRYNRDRSIALNLSNGFVAELYNKDIAVNFGFTKNGMRIPFKINGKYQKLKNDVRFSSNLTIRDTRDIRRKFEDERPTINNGYINFQLNLQADYTVSKLWSISAYFNRQFNEPLVSTIFANPMSRGGIRVKFNVAEL